MAGAAKISPFNGLHSYGISLISAACLFLKDFWMAVVTTFFCFYMFCVAKHNMAHYLRVLKKYVSSILLSRNLRDSNCT